MENHVAGEPIGPEMKLKPLLIMVAPNGARRTKADHPALPMTADELAETARQCLAAGAAAIHVHVRDTSGRHTLDAALYRDAIAAIRERTQGVMAIQITTEAVGLYSPREQMDLVRALHPVSVSIGLREIISDGEAEPARFFAWAGREGIAVQHILYDRADLDRFIDLRRRGILAEPTSPGCCSSLDAMPPIRKAGPKTSMSSLKGSMRMVLKAPYGRSAPSDGARPWR